uniref:Uncharacterized protein n=1 Tax=Ciona intestinalis TaxID=7719 RepID=H2XXX2_CIOIN
MHIKYNKMYAYIPFSQIYLITLLFGDAGVCVPCFFLCKKFSIF